MTVERSILYKNICALMREESPTVDAIKKAAKVGRGTAQRLHDGTDNLQHNTIATIADAFGVEPWQLLVEGLDPDDLPTLHRQDFHWPFRQIDFEAISTLVGTKAANVENGLLMALAGAGVSPRKRDSATG